MYLYLYRYMYLGTEGTNVQLCVNTVLNLSNVESTEIATVSLCKYQKPSKVLKEGRARVFK
jgi:hypothetical protein